MWRKIKAELEALLRGFLFGTCAALLLYLLSPALKKTKEFLQPYFVSQLSSNTRSELIVTLALLVVLAFLAGLPSRILRSLKVGLIPVRQWVWAPSGAVFWIALEKGHPDLGWGTLALTALLTAVTQLIPRVSVTTDLGGRRVTDPDFPVAEDGEDLLGRGKLINELLARVLLDQPPVIAVTGEYGDGKTSLLNLAAGELRRIQAEKAPVIVRFSPWLAADSDTLVLSLLESVIAEIRTELVIPGMGRDAARYARTLLGAVPRLDGLKEVFAERSQDERITALANHISKTQRRVLVILDDLDRMQPNELETIFKILRGTDKLSNVTFLCAFDSLELAAILKASRPNQEATKFIEKFFPAEVHIPRVDPSEFKVLVSKRISDVVVRYEPDSSSDSDRQVEKLWEDGADRYLTNLRRVKLFINRISQSLQQIAGEVNIFDFIRLELIREVTPEVYEEIYLQRGNFWDRDLAFETAYKGPFVWDEKAAKEERRKYYDALKESVVPGRRFVFDLIAGLFPQLRRIPWSAKRKSRTFVFARRRESPAHIPSTVFSAILFSQRSDGVFQPERVLGVQVDNKS